MSAPQRAPALRPARIVRTAMAALSRLSPGLAAPLAWHWFCRPPHPRALGDSADLWRRAERLRVEAEGTSVVAFRFGQGPAVALLHGWGGRAAQLSSFIEPLCAAGLSAVAIDAPAHGASSGRSTTVFGFRTALQEVARVVGPLTGVVAHSLGTIATTLALRDGLSARRVVFVAPILDPWPYAEGFARAAGANARTIESMRAHAQRAHGFHWNELQALTHAPAMRVPLMVVHAPNDPSAPFKGGETLATHWPNARFVATAPLGHNRLLHDPGVVTEAVQFLTV